MISERRMNGSPALSAEQQAQRVYPPRFGDDRLVAHGGRDEAGLDPEIAYLKQRYRDEFREAFVAALGALDERQRNVLRQHHLDGMTIDQLGSLH